MLFVVKLRFDGDINEALIGNGFFLFWNMNFSLQSLSLSVMIR
jgi:hypothetical protein